MNEPRINELAAIFCTLCKQAKDTHVVSDEDLQNMADDIITMPDQAEQLLDKHIATLRSKLA